jgi:hemerythrin
VKTFLRLKDRLLMEGIDAGLMEDTKQLVLDWLVNHIKYSDKALGLFLKRKL